MLDGFIVVLVNGPPGSGKDTAGNALAHAVPFMRVLKFAETVKRTAHALFGLHPGIPLDTFEDRKDRPAREFHGLSPRQAYIDVSERMVKPALGVDWFGRVLVQRLHDARSKGARSAVVTDSGFAAEAMPVLNAVGPDNALLLRLHAEGRGRSFAGDSRGYIELPDVETIDVDANGELTAFQELVISKVLLSRTGRRLIAEAARAA